MAASVPFVLVGRFVTADDGCRIGLHEALHAKKGGA